MTDVTAEAGTTARPARPDRTPMALIAIAGLAAAVSLYVWFPGVLNNDSAQQFQNAVTGHIDDWHPPVMTRLWMAFGPSNGPGTLFALNTVLYWLGFGLTAHTLSALNRRGAAWLVLLGAASPLFVFLNREIITDVGLGSALIAAFGLAFSRRARSLGIPPLLMPILIAVLAYSVLVRTNAAFAVSPVLLYALGYQPREGLWKWAAVSLAVALVLLPLTIAFNRSVLGAANSGAVQRLQLYDLVGIATETGDFGAVVKATGVSAQLPAGCYSVVLWDTLKTPECGRLWYHLAPPGTPERDRVGRLWLNQIAAHPVAYDLHRLKHFNAETLFLIPPAPQCISAPQLHDCAPAGGDHARVLGSMGLTASDYLLKSAIVWPIAWLVLGAMTLVACRNGERRLDVASKVLLVSALLYGIGFLFVGIAMNVRYFLWTIMAVQTAALMFVLNGREPRRRRNILMLGVPTLIVVCLGYAARLTDFTYLVR